MTTDSKDDAAAAQGRLTERRGDLVIVTLAIVAVGAGLVAVVPLFPLYQSQLDLRTGDLTLVYAVYGLALIPALLLVGPLSDSIGRKAVLIPALIGFAMASLLFASARSLMWLVAARMLQGICNGAAWGASVAFVLDLVPEARRRDASLIVSTALPASSAAGAIAFGVAASASQVAIPWLAHAALLVAVAVALTRVEETSPRTRTRLLGARRAFHGVDRILFMSFLVPAMVGAMGATGAAVALLPTMLAMAAEAAPEESANLGSIGIALLIALMAVAQPLSRAWSVHRSAVVGTLLVPVTVAGLAVSAHFQWTAVLYCSLLLLGLGSGLAFRGTLSIAELMSGPGNRAAVASNYNVVLYLGLSVPTLALGYLLDAVGFLVTLLAFSALCQLTTVAAVVRLQVIRRRRVDKPHPDAVGAPRAP